MITLSDIPEDLQSSRKEGEQVFIATFDFYSSFLGIAINPLTKKASSGIWVTPQKEDADPPSEEWIEFFVKTLLDSFREDGSFSVPLYSFVNDHADMTVVPA